MTFIADGQEDCQVPRHFWGDFYSIERGIELETLINENRMENKVFKGQCKEYQVDNSTIDANGRYNARILFYDRYDIISISCIYGHSQKYLYMVLSFNTDVLS